MPKIVEGNLNAKGLKFGLLASRFNSFIVDRLMDGALDALRRNGAEEKDIEVYKCPGSFEIPAVARKMVDSGKFDAVVCLGAVIRGDTPHFDYVAAEVSKGVAQLAGDASIPVTFGVLTTDNIEQAISRAGTKSGNKGFDAAQAAVEMANLYGSLGGKKGKDRK